jgi:hypothetical protein
MDTPDEDELEEEVVEVVVVDELEEVEVTEATKATETSPHPRDEPRANGDVVDEPEPTACSSTTPGPSVERV